MVSPQSETLWRLVGAVYAEVIVFAQEAAIYYQKSSFSKLGDDCMCTSALTPHNGENHRNNAAPPKNESIEECGSHSKASCGDYMGIGDTHATSFNGNGTREQDTPSKSRWYATSATRAEGKKEVY